MDTRSKSTLFLIEQLVVVAVFALCAVACISIMTASYYMAKDSRDTADALSQAQFTAEQFKASGGDVASLSRFALDISLLTFDDGESFGLAAYYNKDWQWVLSDSADIAYILSLNGNILQRPDGRCYYSGVISVDRASGETLVSFPVAVVRG